MRPYRLEMHGFANFREPTVVDFDGADFFVLVGPTGSGKSTVIDAMVFALYGTVPRWDDRRVVANGLAPTANRGTVRLVFDVAGNRYVAARQLRRTARGGVNMTGRLERLTDPTATGDVEDDTQVLAADGEVTDAVEQLLGLPYEHFTRCVVLPQGQFDQFLRARGKDRRDMLLKLLGHDLYEKVMQAANTRAREAEGRARILEEQLGQYADATADAEKAARARVKQLQQLVTQVQDALPGLTEANQARTLAQQRLEDLHAEREILTGITIPEEVTQLANHLTTAAERVNAAKEKERVAQDEDTRARKERSEAPSRAPLERARRDHQDLEAAHAALPIAQTRSTDTLEELGQATAARESADTAQEAARVERDAAVENRDGALGALAEIDRVLAQLAEVTVPAELPEVTQALATARRDLAAAEHEDQVAALRGQLTVGQACPVCEQPVTKLPPAAAGAAALNQLRQATDAAEAAQRQHQERFTAERDQLVPFGAPTAGQDLLGSWQQLAAWVVDAANARRVDRQTAAAAAQKATERAGAASSTLRGAREEHEGARNRENQARAEHAKAEERLRTLAERIANLKKELAQEPAADEITRLLGELDRLEQHCLATDKRLRAAREANRTAEAQHQSLTQQEREAWRQLRTARDPVVPLGAPDLADGPVLPAWTRLHGWAEEQASIRVAAIPTAQHDLDAVETHRQNLAGQLSATLTAHDLTVDAATFTAEDARTAVREALTDAQQQLREVRHRREQAQQLHEKQQQARTKSQVATTLGGLLRGTNFPRWLEETALDVLVAAASENLAQLSNGQYDLTHRGGEFYVVDHADADSERNVRTLSGGETFQASLSMALALSAQLSSLATAGSAELDSVFLDEGFGTLDEATLDTVAGTLENLAARDRMVGVITHVPALAERIPVRYEVRRTPRTSVVTRDAS